MLKEFSIRTGKKGMIDITKSIADFVSESGIQEGMAYVYCPHTTAAITVNENTDPDVQLDLMLALEKSFPDLPQFKHSEGNSYAHIRSSAIGCGQAFIITDGWLLLGVWQGIYFCEFDGPRERYYHVKIVEAL